MVISEYLNLYVHWNASWFPQKLLNVCNLNEQGMKKQPLKFKNIRKAAHHNTVIMKEHQYDFTELIKVYKHTIISPGSEF
jgi:hypothetical protein